MQAEDAIAAQYGQLDAILNAKYQALLLKLRGEPRENLVIAQRAWLKFRDAECKYQLSFPHRPSESGDFRHQCLIGLTKARIAQLENQLQCQGVEGDVGCR